VRGGRWEPIGTELSTALAEYARRLQKPKGSMPALIDEYLATRNDLAGATRSQYRTAGKKLSDIFAEFSPEQVKPVHVAKMKQALRDTPNMTNRMLSLLRQVFDYALERQMVESNPAVGVKRHKEAKRARLLLHEELSRIRAAAGARLQAVIDLCYLTGQRIGDVLNIKVRDLLEDGLAFDQQKTGARLVVAWSPDLRAAVERAKALGGNVRALTLLYNRRGKPPDYRTVNDQWRKACRAAGVEDANLHDIRAKALTDLKAQLGETLGKKAAQALAGHSTEAQTNTYLRGKEVPVVSGPSSFRRLIDAAS